MASPAVSICLLLTLLWTLGCQSDETPTGSAAGLATSQAVEEPSIDSQEPASETGASSAGTERAAASVEYFRHIRPILESQCVVCHRTGESAPFSLQTYDDVAARATQVAEVTARRYMPPWLPEPGTYPLAYARRLSDEQIQMIRTWVDAGMPRGAGSEEGSSEEDGTTTGESPSWQLGKPDLVVRMDDAYELPAEGRDEYRNFVIPVPVDRPRWVRAMELLPENRAVVHHAFMLVDSDGECRRLDAKDAEPGFPGMEAEGAESPEGHFVSWQPGKVATPAPQGMAWRLTPGTDLVLQMHLQPSGKPESVRAAVAFYFTDERPTRFPTKLVLRSTAIDIPPGETDYLLESRYTLPADVRLIGMIPHAHYLGKTLEALAILPDGTTTTLLRIPAWDFNWQGDYRYEDPPVLPRGTLLIQRFTYDNSDQNVRNPNSPPRRVAYGLQSTDEMGELWLQVEPLTASDRETLQRDYGAHVLREIAASCRRKLREDPRDVKSLIELGKTALVLESPAAAKPWLTKALEADPQSADANYYLGHVLLRDKQLTAAHRQFEKARTLDPDYLLAWHDDGLIAQQVQKLPAAEKLFRRALKIDPHHGTSLANLGLVLLQQNKLQEGIDVLERAMLVRPTDQALRELLDQAYRVSGGKPARVVAP